LVNHHPEGSRKWRQSCQQRARKIGQEGKGENSIKVSCLREGRRKEKEKKKRSKRGVKPGSISGRGGSL